MNSGLLGHGEKPSFAECYHVLSQPILPSPHLTCANPQNSASIGFTLKYIIFRQFSSSFLRAMSYIPVSQGSHFSIKNIPFGIFSSKDNPTPRPATAIGEYVLDLSVLAKAGAFRNVSGFDASTLQQVLLPSLCLANLVHIKCLCRDRSENCF